MFWVRDFSIQVFVRKFTSICPPLMRVHENFSRFCSFGLSNEPRSNSNGSWPGQPGALAGFGNIQGQAMGRQGGGARAPHVGHSWSQLPPMAPHRHIWACCPSRGILMVLLLSRFCGSTSCKEQGAGLQDPYGAFSTWDMLWFCDHNPHLHLGQPSGPVFSGRAKSGTIWELSSVTARWEL